MNLLDWILPCLGISVVLFLVILWPAMIVAARSDRMSEQIEAAEQKRRKIA